MIRTARTIPKKLAWGLLACLLVYALVRSLMAAAGKPLWYDELLTLAVSSLGSWQERLTALKLPLDGQPPLFYVIEHFALGLSKNLNIAMRVPSILGLLVTLVCVFVYAKKRGGEVIALLCAVFLVITTLFQNYALEARPYSLTVACIAFALICYQRAPAPFWTALLAISLALAESLHYMAVLAMVPFGLAEAAWFLKTRKIRWPVWAALAAGVVPFLLQWKLLAINKAYYGPHFWAHFKITGLPWAYAWFLTVQIPVGSAAVAVLLVAVAGTYLWHRNPGPDDLHTAEGASETVLLLGFLLLPCLGYLVVTVVMQSGLTPRYVLSAVLGMALGMGFALWRASWRTVALLGIFLSAAVAIQELTFWRSIRETIEKTSSYTETVESFIARAGYPDLPVAMPNYSSYLPVARFCPAHFVDRLTFLVETPSPGHEDVPTFTVNRGMVLLQNYWPIRMNNFDEFTAVHKRFLVYIEDIDHERDWFILRLAQEGWSLQTIAADKSRMVYLASNDGPPSRSARLE